MIQQETLTTKLWSTKDVAEYLGVPVSTIYQWRSKRYGPTGRRIGRYVKYVPEEVRSWASNQPEELL